MNGLQIVSQCHLFMTEEILAKHVMLYAFLGSLKTIIFFSISRFNKQSCACAGSPRNILNTYLIPGSKQCLDFRWKWTFSKLQSHCPTTIDHEVKPSVFPGHRVSFTQMFRPASRKYFKIMQQGI